MATIEYNRFLPAPNGDKGEHIKVVITDEDVEAVGDASTNHVDVLADVLLALDKFIAERAPIYEPEDVPFEPAPKKVTVVKGQQQKPVQRQQQRGVACGICGGPTWDNRKGKEDGTTSERAPDFKCKDKEECGGAMWLRKDGEHGEWKAA
jgi:hypothetical protein